jgi:SAM-dependent methyltransferase
MQTALEDSKHASHEKSAGVGKASCRFCATTLSYTLVDLGMSPLCESYVSVEKANQMEPFYPLHVYVCDSCYLAQLEQYVSAEEIFTEYAYFSSYSDSWLEHAKRYTDMIVGRFALGGRSLVMELASNDGYLLQYFVQKGIKAIGVEPAANVAAVAEKKGVPTVVKFFGRETARELAAQHGQVDLLIGNNVLAQVPDLNSFVAGVALALKPEGTVTMEFPHLLRLIEGVQFDTIYHEHFSYFSFLTVERIFGAHALRIYDVQELWTHGGSLRIWACPERDGARPPSSAVSELRGREIEAGLTRIESYAGFEDRVREAKRRLLELLIGLKRAGKSIAGYGAPGKGNTLLNYCGIRGDFLDFTVDQNPYKQGKFTPGTHIPIAAPARLDEARPDYVLVLPWNLKDEIIAQLAHVRDWGGAFIVPVPEAAVIR